MFSQIILCALAASPLVAAHGKISVVTGDLGGNGTGLGVKGGVVPGAGPNYLTEVDTTIFWSKDITTDQDIGFTDEAGDNQLANLTQAMQLSGDTLPQVSATGGSVKGTWHTVTSDGFGAVQVLVDGTATAQWSTAAEAKVTTQVPGNQGNPPSSKRRSLMGHFFGKRATNVNEDYPFAIDMPADTTCSGTINGLTNLCLVKVSNNNENGPFGGVFVVQMGNSTTASKEKREVNFSA